MRKVLLILISSCLLLSTCSKPGKGGDATLSVYLMHHSNPILSKITWPDTVYVKYDAKSLPGTHASDFDTWYVGTVGSSMVSCTELRWGNYYLYGVGYDSTCLCRVSGGMRVHIPRRDRHDNIDVNLSVTE